MEQSKYGLLFIGIGVILLIIAIFKMKKQSNLKNNGKCVKGVLVNYKEQMVDDDRNRGSGVTVSIGNSSMTTEQNYRTLYAGIYEYEVNGIKYYVCDESYNSIRKPLGTVKDIYYMEGKPESAIMKNTGGNIFILVAGVIFVAAGLFMFIS